VSARRRLLIAIVLVEALFAAWALRIFSPSALTGARREQPSPLPPAIAVPPSMAPQGQQIFPSPGAVGVPYGKQRYDLTSIPVVLALTSVIEMPDLTPEQARRLLAIVQEVEPAAAGERGLDMGFCDAAMQT